MHSFLLDEVGLNIRILENVILENNNDLLYKCVLVKVKSHLTISFYPFLIRKKAIYLMYHVSLTKTILQSSGYNVHL